jgi:hypothetical protein
MIVITERGIGILELKHYYGRISIGYDNSWYAGPKQIHPGSKYANPHEQVQGYAEEIRGRMMLAIRPDWLRNSNDLKFQTAVCFTHPDADVSALREDVRRGRSIQRKEWEDGFDVITPDDVPLWITNLRFQVSKGYSHDYEPFRLKREMVKALAEKLLRATEWEEILELMPTGEPYAYLTLVDDEEAEHTYGLDRDELLVGRDPNACSLVIPARYSRASRLHARIVRNVHGVTIEDLSTHGTFADGKKIMPNHPYRLQHEQVIMLGGPISGEKVCTLKFLERAVSSIDPQSTEMVS